MPATRASRRRGGSDSDDDAQTYTVPVRAATAKASAASAGAADDAFGDDDAAGGALRVAHVAGLSNLGNTCFFNSVVQVRRVYVQRRVA
jgi:hypothetical protein